MAKPHIVKCPTIGGLVTLRELAAYHGLTYNLVYARHRSGKRGKALVEPLNEKFSRQGCRAPSVKLQQNAENFKRARQTALAMPLARIASASHRPSEP